MCRITQVCILQGVLQVMLTKYCTCAAKYPGPEEQLSWPRTGFSIIVNAKGIFIEQLECICFLVVLVCMFEIRFALISKDFRLRITCFFEVLETPEVLQIIIGSEIPAV